LSTGKGTIPRVLVGDFGEGHVEGSGKVGTGTVEVISSLDLRADMFSIRHRSSLDVRFWMRSS
jgi:hypothetical protein